VTVRPLTALRPTVKVASTVPAAPSATVASPIVSVGVVSSSVIVPTPVGLLSVAKSAVVTLTLYVSSISSSMSAFTVTSTVFAVSPMAKASAPDVAR
jgi:hypothetical protein